MNFKTLLAACLTAAFSACSTDMDTIYQFKDSSNKGQEVDFSQFKGKVLLIANTASKCGFTPQYEGLEALYQQYKDQGLVVIGFPCDQFGHQEPGTADEIETFCKLNYGVTFPLMAKTEVNGENANPIFQWLYGQLPFQGFGDSDTAKMMDKMLSGRNPDYAANPDIKWNFTKFLVDKKGKAVARFEPTATPESMKEAIEKLLK